MRRRAVYNQGKGELAFMVSTSDAQLDRRSPPNDARYQSVMQDVNDSRKRDKLLHNKIEFSYDIISVDQAMSPLLCNPQIVLSCRLGCIHQDTSRTCNCQCGEAIHDTANFKFWEINYPFL